MPVHFNEVADDPLAFDRQASFTLGMVTFVRANLLNEQQATALFDFDPETNLVVSQRRGFRRIGDLGSVAGSDTPQGLWWFDSKSQQYLLALAGGKLYRCDSTHAWSAVSFTATVDVTSQAFGMQIVDQFFLSTADYGSRARKWTGAELESSSSGNLITDGPARLSTLTSMRYRLYGINAESTDEVYVSKYLPTDTTPFTVGATPILPFRVGEGEGDQIVAILPWKGLFSLVVIKKASVWGVDVSQASPDASAATETSAFGIQKLSGRVGCVAPRSVITAGNDILFLADDGVRSIARTMQDADGQVSEPISQPIRDIVDRINPATRHLSCACFWNGRFIISVPLDNALVPDTTLVLNQKTGGWVVWTGIQPLAWTVATWDAQPARLVCIDSRGQVLEYMDHVPQVNATTSDYRDNVTGVDTRIPWRVRTRGMAWGDQFSPKQADHAEFEFDRSQAIVDIDVFLDNDSGRRLASKERTGFGEFILPPDNATPSTYPKATIPFTLGELKVKRIRKSLLHYPNAREVMFEIREAADLTTEEQSESGLVRLRSIQAGAYLETLEEEG